MPVLDHAVHPSTVGGEKYGCNRKPNRQPFYWARTVDFNLIPPLDRCVQITDQMSRLCRYDMSLQDAKCKGCPQRGLGEEYSKDIRGRGA